METYLCIPIKQNRIMEKIKNITIVTVQGVKIYSVGTDGIESITIKGLYFTGDPFDHYVGFDKDGNMLFSINCLTPCVVEYLV